MGDVHTPGPAPAQWKRVLIVGGPGSGKTTLGKCVAQIIDGSFHELDAIGYEGGSGAERPLEDRLRDVGAIALQDRWVAEGSYTDWIADLAVAADGIVLLDPPWRVARNRIVMRHVKASLKRSNKHSGLRKLWKFLRHCKGYYTGSQPRSRRMADWLEAYAAKVVTCRTNRDVEQIVSAIRRRSQGSR